MLQSLDTRIFRIFATFRRRFSASQSCQALAALRINGNIAHSDWVYVLTSASRHPKARDATTMTHSLNLTTRAECAPAAAAFACAFQERPSCSWCLPLTRCHELNHIAIRIDQIARLLEWHGSFMSRCLLQRNPSMLDQWKHLKGAILIAMFATNDSDEHDCGWSPWDWSAFVIHDDT